MEKTTVTISRDNLSFSSPKCPWLNNEHYSFVVWDITQARYTFARRHICRQLLTLWLGLRLIFCTWSRYDYVFLCWRDISDSNSIPVGRTSICDTSTGYLLPLSQIVINWASWLVFKLSQRLVSLPKHAAYFVHRKNSRPNMRAYSWRSLVLSATRMSIHWWMMFTGICHYTVSRDMGWIYFVSWWLVSSNWKGRRKSSGRSSSSSCSHSINQSSWVDIGLRYKISQWLTPVSNIIYSLVY